MARLRVVAGSVGGRRLVAPRSAARPTTDRVKEAVFASLGPDRLEGAAVLDLYAGSGALGIEALSRGAARAVFVDHDRAAVDAISANLAATGFTAIARVLRSAVAAFLVPPVPDAPFDLVLLDPPYDAPSTGVTAVLRALAAPGVLAPGATVVLERPRRPGAIDGAVDLPEHWQNRSERAYGDTLVLVATA